MGRSSASDDSQLKRTQELVVLSAKSAVSLEDLVDEWVDYLDENGQIPLRDIAFTAATGRSHLSHRLAMVGSTPDDIRGLLDKWRGGRTPTGHVDRSGVR